MLREFYFCRNVLLDFTRLIIKFKKTIQWSPSGQLNQNNSKIKKEGLAFEEYKLVRGDQS